MKKWLRTHVYQVHLAAFLLMVSCPIPLYAAVKQGNMPVVYILLCLEILANLMLLAVR